MFEENAVCPNKENDRIYVLDQPIKSCQHMEFERSKISPLSNPTINVIFIVRNNVHVSGYINYQDNVQISLGYQNRWLGLGP
jgi:hypothetical protein